MTGKTLMLAVTAVVGCRPATVEGSIDHTDQEAILEIEAQEERDETSRTTRARPVAARAESRMLFLLSVLSVLQRKQAGVMTLSLPKLTSPVSSNSLANTKSLL